MGIGSRLVFPALCLGAIVAMGTVALAQAPDEQRGPGRGTGPMWDDAGGMIGPGMWGSGMAGMGGHGMSPMMFVMIDTDSDGAISREEMDAVHARMFDLVDADKDGLITAEEMRAFRRSWMDDN